MNVLFVADPLATLDPAVESSVGLMHAAQNAGATVWVTEAPLLEAVDGRARAFARRVHLAPARPAGDHRWIVADPWFRATAREHVWLDDMAAVFLRTEPPLDETFVTATLILDLVDPAGTALVNHPTGLRVCSEHLFPLRFPDLIPPTVVTADRATLRSFVDDQGSAVVKPVDGFSGRGVLRLDRGDANLPSLIDVATHNGARVVVLQQFLPEVADGNKRIFLLDGQPEGAVYRFPADGDFRIDDRPVAEAPLTARDRQICARLTPALTRHGIRMAGIDVIGSHLIEVNVTSAGCLHKADALLGWSLCAEVLDRVLGTPQMRRLA